MWMKVLISKATRAGCGSVSVGEDAEQQSHSATTEQHLPTLTGTEGTTVCLNLTKCSAEFTKSEPPSSGVCP